jgi:hypothetical protein
MDNADIKNPTTTSVSHLEAQLASLHHLVTSVLVLLVVISGTLSIYLLRQWRMTSKDLSAIRPTALQIIADYHKEREPRMDAFIEKLRDYGRTHSDFAYIMNRYQLVSNAPVAGGAPSNTPKK